MGIHYKTTTLREIIASHNAGHLVLPNFQREFVWDVDAQRQLLASLLADIPIGSILLLEGTSDEFASRRFGRMGPANPNSECIFLLDGQQRLSCINHFVSDPLSEGASWQDELKDIYYKLRYRWFIRVVPRENEPDPFGYHNLNFQTIRQEPELLDDFIECFRINLTDKGRDPSHPKWLSEFLIQDASDEGTLKHKMATSFAERGWVPLWEVGEQPFDARSLHGRTIQIIAHRQEESLLARTGPLDKAVQSAIEEVRPDLLQVGEALELDGLQGAIKALSAAWTQGLRDFFGNLSDREVPQVILPAHEIGRAIPIFEVMNRGGTPLTTFDLVVAKMARKSEESLADRLREYALAFSIDAESAVWGAINTPDRTEWYAHNYNFVIERDTLSNHFKTSLLSLLSARSQAIQESVEALEGEHLKRAAILDLHAETIEELWQANAAAVMRAWAFLNLRCGVRNSSDLRNKLVVLPLAFVVADDDVWNAERSLDRLEYWYWCSVLGGTYTERQSDNCIHDIRSLHTWMAQDGCNPFEARESRVLEAVGYSDRDSLLRTNEESGVASDVGDYLAQYVLSRNPIDFLEQSRLVAWSFGRMLELHHVIPLQEATSIGHSTKELRSQAGRRHKLNSPLNRTYLLRGSNQVLGARSIQRYTQELPSGSLASHFFPADSTVYCRGASEQAEDYYNRLLGLRYDSLLQAVHEELSRLKH